MNVNSIHIWWQSQVLIDWRQDHRPSTIPAKINCLSVRCCVPGRLDDLNFNYYVKRTAWLKTFRIFASTMTFVYVCVCTFSFSYYYYSWSRNDFYMILFLFLSLKAVNFSTHSQLSSRTQWRSQYHHHGHQIEKTTGVDPYIGSILNAFHFTVYLAGFCPDNI